MNRERILEFTGKQRIPLVTGWGPWVRVGGFMSNGPDLDDLVRRAATHVDKILKGAKPADLPVEQPTKFELVINLKTAKALGITIPPSLLARADRVVDRRRATLRAALGVRRIPPRAPELRLLHRRLDS